MNRTKIEWCDYTFNPISGCLHGCPYCYARRIAERFGGSVETCPTGRLHELDDVFYADPSGPADGSRFRPYPYMFDPTFHRYRLDEPQRVKKPSTIFVCSMGDLFGEWVPDEWIRQVFEACYAAPQHRYLFLTKSPSRYDDIRGPAGWLDPDSGADFWLGATVTNNDEMRKAYGSWARWLSVEPLLEDIHFPPRCRWVVLGAETGNRKGKIVPEKAWIDSIVRDCDYLDTPVFMKESLRPIMGDDFRQELPWEEKRSWHVVE